MARAAASVQAERMQHRCEVCESFQPNAEFGDNYRVVEVRFDVRTVRLCVAHARIAESSGASSFEQLREIFGEERRRSFVPRRDPSVKRPSPGRRATDTR